MPDAAASPDSAILPLLQGVSRSFYLSIRLLPASLRKPVALGYLLARASDTIADAPGLPAPVRLQALENFASSMQQGTAPPKVATSDGMSREEAALLQRLPECMAWLATIAPEDRDDIRTVLGHITRGQILDIERPRLQTAEELDEYTYLVAGCVGEFWTRLGFRHVPHFASLPSEEMLELGRSYGKALQLINVIRDEAKDDAIGRRYVPEGTSRELWLERAQAGLRDGMRYVGALRGARVRVASALPALIGARTLALLRTQGAGAKMPRSEVRALIFRVALSLGSDAALQREFRRWDNPRR